MNQLKGKMFLMSLTVRGRHVMKRVKSNGEIL